ncbi:MAG: TolC family protein [Muribaculaceae bacterium]|nr:TolC family protein [Muribaculaceae bacterium]
MKRNILLISIFTSLLLASCSGTRNLTKPEIDMPDTYTDNGTVDSLNIADIDWWKFYSDSTLCYMINEALSHNRDLLIAAAHVEELGQLYGVDKLCYLPTVTGAISGDNETNDYYNKKYSSDPEFGFKARLNWEIDLWGGLSKARQRSAARYMASVEDRRAMEITIIAQTATAYFNLVALQNELNIVKRTLVTREENLEKAYLRFQGGMTSEIVYQQAKVELATTAALVPNLNRRITLAKNALTLLMGRFPDDLWAISQYTLDENLPERLPIGVPSTLLERRPDLRASEQQLKAALAGVGVSYSNQFPKLSISLTGGWENDGVNHLFESPFSYILGNITGTILDFGRNKRKYKASIAAYEQARYTYEKNVMQAFTEVDNAANSYRQMQLTADRRRELRDAALKYVDLANRQYLAGSISYIDVLDASRRYFDAQITLSNAVRDEYLALVDLYRSLGGGWSR